MKKLFLVFCASLFLIQCASVKRYNDHLNTLISVEDLQSDIDFTYKKLKRLHPNLYWYISKEQLDYKFDSLKNTIKQPMKSIEFYKKISPLVAAVRQGHTLVFPPSKLLTKRQSNALTKKGTGPFSQFEYDYFNDKLYVVKNKSYNKSIKAGTEIVAINSVKPQQLLKEHNRYYSSDGFNTTLKMRTAGRRIPSFFTTENGIQDSLNFTLKYNDSTRLVVIKRFNEDSLQKKEKNAARNLAIKDKTRLKEFKRKKRVNGYNPDNKNYNRNLTFLERDSTVALMKIRGFKNGNFRTFYQESFKKIKDYKASTLIIDLRNNGGGRVTEIAHLYSYLSDSTFVFLDKSEVVSKTSLLSGAYFTGGSLGIKAAKAIFAPILYGYLLLTVKKNSDGKYLFATQNKPRKVKPDAFRGKVFVLINGQSFSASSAISSNLKGSKRATFVGEETGGAYNGTVAGFMPEVELPKSKLLVRIGTMLIAPHYKTTESGRGILPDILISPTLEDRINGKDPELEWILNDVKANSYYSTK